MKASLIVPVFNEIEGIKDFMESLYQQTYPLDEIILVDGASTDGTLEFLQKEEKEGRIRLFSFSGNIAQARNFAIKRAQNELILCTDAGCIVDQSWAEQLITQFENSKDQVIGGVSSFSLTSTFQKKAAQHLLSKKIEDQFVSSRNIAFYKHVWQEVGGYPENLTKWGEDTYFNYQIEKKGYNIARCKKAVVCWTIGKDFYDFFKLFRNYTHGDMEVLVLYHLKQSNSVLQGFFLSLALLFQICAFCFFGFESLVFACGFLLVLALYKPKKTGISFNFLFNFVKFSGIFVGFWRGLISGLKIKIKKG